MRINKYLLIVGCILLFQSASRAQTPLTLQEAIEIGLKNNFDILVLKNDATIAANNNTLGNAGMLPKVILNATTNFSNNNTKQNFSTGASIDKNGVQSNNITSGVYLAWTLFDGLKMFATHNRLNEMQAMGELSSKIQLETTLANIITSYYNVVKQKQLIVGLSENINISTERLNIAQKKLDIGSGSKLEVLQAQTDKNAQTSVLYREKTNLEEYKTNLNQLLARSAETEFEVADSIPVTFLLKYEDLKLNLQSNNTNLLYAQRNINKTNQLLHETRAEQFPSLSFNANYLFSRAQNQAGLILLNQNLGLNIGLTASWSIFNGFTINNRIKNAKLEIENANYNYTNLKSGLEQQLIISFKKYQDDQKILALEENNLQLVKEAVTIALERFRIGSSNTLELKEIQKSYDDALVRLVNARYNAKVSETQLVKLNGNLLK
jgi:outer membrane protein TolC